MSEMTELETLRQHKHINLIDRVTARRNKIHAATLPEVNRWEELETLAGEALIVIDARLAEIEIEDRSPDAQAKIDYTLRQGPEWVRGLGDD
jgi:hypothetical protein